MYAGVRYPEMREGSYGRYACCGEQVPVVIEDVDCAG